ncbi:phosphatidylserine decarboxylase [Nanoarchaeota archaeon]
MWGILIIIISIILIVTILFMLFYIWFNRNPNRQIPQGDNIVAPADGKIIKILSYDFSKVKQKNKIKIPKGWLGKIYTSTNEISKKGHIISIFMSPLDVHVNRIPLEGKVIKEEYSPGKFFKAYDFEKSLENEKNEIIINNNKIGKYKVIQIAGWFARRINTYINPGNQVKKGQVFGRINFGSQVTMIFPNKIKLTIKEGQKVKAGQSILANLK